MHDMRGKVCIITGANAGIGKHTVIGLGRLGARVVMVARDPVKGAAAHREVLSAVGGDAVDLVRGDLATLGSTNALAAELLARYPVIDVLINNAGVWITKRRENADGYEATLATNHLAPYLLTARLLGRLRAAEQGRVVTVTSELHRRGVVDFDDLHTTRRRYRGVQAYADSKLMNIMFTRALARRLAGTGVTANAVHPGKVHTEITRKAQGVSGFLARTFTPVVGPFLLTAEQGAATSIHVASSAEGGEVSGKYFAKSAVAPPRPRAEDDAVAERLWAVSAELCGLDAGAWGS
ncbi:MAG: SDR family oxidoreductase [Myxococcota bacterium]